ncbi:MAG: leucyl/phenylalanyl-tRNA--protein transferase [Myxococcaceae bacterium]|nr:leucyl/phenylalanyl-tRNA--protein transferase [Myxococcaceae bacterium]
MPVYVLDPQSDAFPDPNRADRSGLLAVGGDLRPTRLLTAYAMGIFPWYNEGDPILWHSPDPRFVLQPSKFHLPRSLAKTMRKRLFEVRFDSAFEQVIEACATTPRPGQHGTWITAEMKDAYITLHRMGYAHSIESWQGGALVGGLYGVSLGRVFFGESMFAHVSDASKVAFASLVPVLVSWGFTLIDCQQETAHLARFGAEAWPRHRFLAELARALEAPTRVGAWKYPGPPDGTNE